MSAPVSPSVPPAFRADYAMPDSEIAAALLSGSRLDPAADQRIDARATRLITAIRETAGGIGGVEALLREYALTTREGLALMVLAEALLRVPDGATADRLIEDKLGQGDFEHHETKSSALIVSASAWALGLSARLIQPGETPGSVLGQMAKRIGLPAVRTATRQAMRVMGSHFVLGQTIAEALDRAASHREYRYSFDMLGEGARTAEDADRYLSSYAAAIEAIGARAGNSPLPDRPGISVKLSALHPRYDAMNRDAVLKELVPRLTGLALKAKAHDLNFTIDAEEADRLELSLDVIDRVAQDPALADWTGFGLAIQAYQKRALGVIDHMAALAKRLNRTFMVRLVKGAYWDTEVKRAQERGLEDYPVFTRKAMTDLNYLAAAERMLAHRPVLYPQFATHNALTMATIAEMAGGPEGYEFQRLHGMGEASYAALLAEDKGFACRTYAPVGGHQDLLAYLVRRLLENGANSSFVSQAGNPDMPIKALLERPALRIGQPKAASSQSLPKPLDLFRHEGGKGRKASRGVEFGHAASLAALEAEIAAGRQSVRTQAASLINGVETGSRQRPVLSPVDGSGIGHVREASVDEAEAAVASAHAAFASWEQRSVDARAALLDQLADRLEERRGSFLHLLQIEAGKTLDDALAELREAVDFCRYYAREARRHGGEQGLALPGPVGEENRLILRGRGVFVCIAPWNFPLAIFLGQIAAALVMGNTVVAKPAPQTPLIAAAAVRLAHEIGIPKEVLNLVTGDGAIGAALVGHAAVAGVAFTGSTRTGRAINRALADKDGPIVPLIAETGGLNAMIVDATALPEQVTDDVILSAFRSAGQRCSALRLLCLQEDVADRVLTMIKGAMDVLAVGDPGQLKTQIGPVIDEAARGRLMAHVEKMDKAGRILHRVHTVPADGHFVAPHLIRLDRVEDLTEEHFGPLLHVVRYKAADRDKVIEAIASSGYGLTLGIHSRIDADIQSLTGRMRTGNIYVNRSMIGAVVGVQPFGGHGLSGTGPKAGGPHYLPRFATEQTITINTAAAGGNAALLAGGDG
jgi:RHH-type transcriptional regulator, proline utilization regulon repressor / proline dehydrogenase / delta 1-pyrroline-5-carboxylate dehydrogenase